MAITSWTDNGMQWPIQVGQPILTSHINAVRNAYQERAEAQSTNNAYNSFLFEVVAGQPVTFYRPAAFQNLIEQIEQARDAFLNFDQGRQWNHNTVGVGGETLVSWTEASMLADMGIPSFEVPSRDGHVTVKWLNEQYEFINRIVWTNPRTPPFQEDVDYFTRIGADVSWATAVAEMNADAWSSSAIEDARHTSYKSGAEFVVVRKRQDHGFSGLYNDNGAKHTASVYAKFDEPAPPFPDTPFYENNDYSVAEDTWSEIETISTPTSVQNHTFSIGLFGDATVSQPASSSQRRGWLNGGASDDTKIAIKYDNSEGFQFQFP